MQPPVFVSLFVVALGTMTCDCIRYDELGTVLCTHWANFCLCCKKILSSAPFYFVRMRVVIVVLVKSCPVVLQRYRRPASEKDDFLSTVKTDRFFNLRVVMGGASCPSSKFVLAFQSGRTRQRVFDFNMIETLWLSITLVFSSAYTITQLKMCEDRIDREF